jgi:hypothetical protein
MRLTLDGFASELGVSTRSVSTWEAGDDKKFPRAVNQEALDTFFSTAKTEISDRFYQLAGLYPTVESPSIRPAAERAFFGVGPVTVAIPVRLGLTDRTRPLIAAEDAETAERVDELLASLLLATTRRSLDPSSSSPPDGDTVVICGPKSAPVGASLLAADPCLGMVKIGDRWWIKVRATGETHGSLIDIKPPESVDLAYIGRHVLAGRVVVHVAGLHAIGSLGAVNYLSHALPELFAKQGDNQFSLAVRCTFDGLNVTDTEIAVGPYIW